MKCEEDKGFLLTNTNAVTRSEDKLREINKNLLIDT